MKMKIKYKLKNQKIVTTKEYRSKRTKTEINTDVNRKIAPNSLRLLS